MTMHRTVFLFLTALLSQGAFADSALPIVDRIRPDEAPAVDGRLDDAVWSRLTWRSDFRRLPGDLRTDPLNPTSFAMAVDDRAVYFAIRADYLDMESFKAAKPKSIWVTDDCEVMLSPSGSSFEFYQFAMAAKGGIREAVYHYEGGFTHPDPYAPEWRSAVAMTETGYTVEIAVPFSALYMTRGEKWSDVWRVNVTRSTFSGSRQCVTWSPLRTTFIDPENFNRVKSFPRRRIEEDVRIVEAVPEIRYRTPKGYEGDIRVTVYVARGGEFELTTPYGGKAGVVLKRGENTVRVAAVFPEQKRYQLPLTLVRADDSTRVYREYPVVIAFEPIRMRLTTPCYADCFYPGQDASRIAGRIECALEGKVFVSCETGKRIELPPGGGEFSFDNADYPNGKVVLTAVCGADRCSKTVRKVEPDGHRLSWVENGNLVIDGKPVFRRNFYAPKHAVSKSFEARFVADGFHLTPEVTSGGTFEPHKLLGREDEARRDAPPSPAMLSKIDEVLDKAKGRDFAYYYISDEPECRSLSPVYFKHVYDYVKRRDPRHVILMVTRDPDRFADCYDWVEPHPYLNPFYDRGQRKHFTPMNRMASFLGGCVGRSDKVVGFTPMVFSYEEGSSANDFPSFDEYLCNVWTMLAHGAKTIYPFRGGTLAERPGIYESARFANASIEELEDFFLLGKRTLLTQTPDYEVARWDLGKRRLFAAVSLAWTNVVAATTGLEGRWHRFRSSDRRALDVCTVARFDLAPFEVLVATTEATCGTRLPTAEEVREKVRREECERTHRDNQMFGRRTEVEFTGSSPFWGKSTIFNGVHDDFVARFAGTNEWLEIAFPRGAISFDRLVFWGENMEGVAVKVREGGSWCELSPEKAVARVGAVEFSYGRTVRTVRLRLEFRKPGMLLSEVEFPKVAGQDDVRAEAPVVGGARTKVEGEFALDESNVLKRTSQVPDGWYGAGVKVEALADGGFRVSGKTASRSIRFLPEWKWLEVDLRSCRPTSEGFRYRGWGVNLVKYMGYVINDGYVVRPGLWTIPLDPHDEPIAGCLSVTDLDYDLDFGYMRFSAEPLTRFRISKSGAGPLKKGDVLSFDLVLERSCADVTCLLEHLSNNRAVPFSVNGLTSVPLRRVDDKGRHWRAEVVVTSLGRATDVPTARAIILGGTQPLTVMTRFPARVADEGRK